MNMTKEQVALAVQSGMELLGPESEVQIPAKLGDGVFFLKQLLIGIGQGQIALSPAVQKEPPAGAPTPPEAPPAAPNRKARRAAKKVAKNFIFDCPY